MKRSTILKIVLVFYFPLLLSCHPRGAAGVAVYTGREWEVMKDNNSITTFRDNPPLTGLITISPGQVQQLPRDNPDFRVSDPRHQRIIVWNRNDFRFNGSHGWTYRNEENSDGFLGIAPVARLTSSTLLRWHSNGLLLLPGQRVGLQLEQRRWEGRPYEGSWQWRNYPEADGGIILDQNTVVAGVTVIVVRQAPTETMATDRGVAELLFDGRTVDRLSQSLSSGGNLNSYVKDRDTRPGWRSDQFGNPHQGRDIHTWLHQEIDSVWCQCGINYGQNIQFRLVRYREINASDIPNSPSANIHEIATDQIPYWIQNALGFVNQLDGVGSDAAPTIPIVIVQNYGSRDGVVFRTGVAQTWRQGIVLGERDIIQNTGSFFPQHVIAHELGHFLGYDSEHFYDGSGGPNNLMSNGAAILTRRQCEIAYAVARNYAIRRP